MEKYSGKALKTKEIIIGSVDKYTVNKLYKNNINGFYWFINRCGYLHILEPCYVKIDFFMVIMQ